MAIHHGSSIECIGSCGCNPRLAKTRCALPKITSDCRQSPSALRIARAKLAPKLNTARLVDDLGLLLGTLRLLAVTFLVRSHPCLNASSNPLSRSSTGTPAKSRAKWSSNASRLTTNTWFVPPMRYPNRPDVHQPGCIGIDHRLLRVYPAALEYTRGSRDHGRCLYVIGIKNAAAFDAQQPRLSVARLCCNIGSSDSAGSCVGHPLGQITDGKARCHLRRSRNCGLLWMQRIEPYQGSGRAFPLPRPLAMPGTAKVNWPAGCSGQQMRDSPSSILRSHRQGTQLPSSRRNSYARSR